MKSRTGRCVLLALALCTAASAAMAQAEVAGIRYEDTAVVAGQPLRLNGAGVRYKAVFKVYTAGLYLPQPVRSAEEALALQGPKRISITMLREIDSAELGKLFTRGVEDNMERSGLSKLVPGLMRMSQLFTDFKRLKAGDSFALEWVPGTGTVVTVNGVPQGAPFKEPEFYSALLRIWLGPVPADHRLKDALLGRPTA